MYVFYEHDENEYIPLRVILIDVVGYYNDYKDNSKYDVKYNAERMNFRLRDDDDLLNNFIIFVSILEKN